jgi:hypothetical protein
MDEGLGMLGKSAKSESPPFFAATYHTFTISNSVALRVYSNTDPQNMKIADLQKGLILLCNGIPVVGEGTGFGVPIVKYSDGTVFSGSSFLFFRICGDFVEIRKEFFMDLVTRDGFLNFNVENPRIRTLFHYFNMVYQRHKRIAKYSLIVKHLLFKVGVKSSFIRNLHRGVVVVTYVVDQNRIKVKLNLSLLERNNLEKVFVLNEQGAHFFNTYSDSEGLRLIDEEIGAWRDVTAQAAKIVNEKNKIEFKLKNIEGAKLRRGREVMKDSLDWIGLDYELDPEYHHFEYDIELLGDIFR